MNSPTLTRTAARIVKETTDKLDQPLPHDMEQAWAVWSKGVKKVDERGMALLRAAFEVAWRTGFEAGSDCRSHSRQQLIIFIFMVRSMKN